MARYTIREFVVSDANPSEFEFTTADKEPTSALAMLAGIIDRSEIDQIPSPTFPEYDVRTVRVIIEITR
jgi:hypothetical protein